MRFIYEISCFVVRIRLSDKNFGGNAESAVQGPDHGEAEAALAVEDFGDFAFAFDVLGEVSRFQAQLIHAETNGLHGVGRRNGMMRLFVVLNQQRPYFQFLLLWGAGFRVHEGLHMGEGGFVFFFAVNEFGVHGAG
jgi:hypothetical protein